jgi:hypothetical protein
MRFMNSLGAAERALMGIGVWAVRGRGGASAASGPGWIRTSDQGIMSPLL